MLYCSWDMLHDRCNYFSFWAIFCPFTPITDWKIKIIYIKKKNKKKKMKKTPVDIIILHKCTKNHDHIDHMLYCSWDMVCDGCNYFSFWAIFCSFSPRKICLEISSFYTCAPKIMIRWCTFPEKWCAMDGRTKKVTHIGGCPT